MLEASAKVTGLSRVFEKCPARPYIELRVPHEFGSVERLTITTVSHDQGFSHEEEVNGGTYWSCWSWFELGVISPSNHERAPVRNVQYNVHARFEPKRHQNVYEASSPEHDIRRLVSSIRGGDTIQLIPRAVFAAWANYVYEAELKVEGHAAPGGVSPYETNGLHQPLCGGLQFGPQPKTGLYAPLSEDGREIRYMAIDSGAFDDPITCTLRTLSLDDSSHPEYNALSYCWGDMNDVRPLQVRVAKADSTGPEGFETHSINITSTLFEAIRHLRPETGGPYYLWADFVCINQSNLGERAKQVAIMRRIYSEASQVHVWLGLGIDALGTPGHSPSTTDLFNMARMIRCRYVDCGVDAYYGSEAKRHKDDTHADVPNLTSPIALDQFSNWWRLCDFAWFRRTWVLQEVSNARNKRAIVHCGRDTLLWPVILRVAQCIRMMMRSKHNDMPTSSVMPPIFLRLLRQNGMDGATDPAGNHGRLPGILDVLVGGHDLDATDPRDKIFALLQFGAESHDVERLPALVRPDYSKPAAHVFADFTRWWMIHTGSLRILSAVHTTRYRGWQQMSAGDPPELGTGPGLNDRPTWSFWHGGVASWGDATLGLSSKCQYKAAGDTAPDAQLLQLPSSGANEPEDQTPGPLSLLLRGRRICTIESIEAFPIYERRANKPQPPGDLVLPFIKIFDPIATRRTWLWNREGQQTATLPDLEVSQHDDENEVEHYKHCRDHGFSPALDCCSPCYFHGDSVRSATATEGGGPPDTAQLLGLCPYSARPGDLVVVLDGGPVPYLLREVQSNDSTKDVQQVEETEKRTTASKDQGIESTMAGDGDEAEGLHAETVQTVVQDGVHGKDSGRKKYYLVGECFLRGYMHGEAVQKDGKGGALESEIFELV